MFNFIRCHFSLNAGHNINWVSTYPPNSTQGEKTIKGHPTSKGDIIIGNDVWIGYGATILSGVKIGDGAIIGARAVVTKNVEPYSIVVGNPAKEKRKRFNKKTIKKLLKIKWWNWPIEKIQKNEKTIWSPNIKQLFEKTKK